MDYQELLKKYMRHVICQEGIAFLPFLTDIGHNPVVFSREEETTLQAIEKSIGSRSEDPEYAAWIDSLPIPGAVNG